MSNSFNYFNNATSDFDALPRFVNLSDFANAAINLVLGGGFMIAFLTIAYPAISYILSAGDPKKTTRAWNTFLWGVIACAVILAAVLLKNIVTGAFGVTDPTINSTNISF